MVSLESRLAFFPQANLYSSSCLRLRSPLESSANFVYMASSNGTIALLDTTTMKKLVLAQEDEEIACVDLSIDGAVLALSLIHI